MIYLDHSATTPLDERVLEAMLPWLRDNYGNASSIYQSGRAARLAIEDARTEVAQLIGAHPAEVIFTSGGTESNNSVIHSCAMESRLVDHIAYSAIEHHAVIHPAQAMQRLGIDVSEIRVGTDGRVVLEDLATYNRARQLVCVMHVNNEIGTIQPLADIRASVPDALLHTDAVQSFGKIPVHLTNLGVDFATISGHKINGPKGVGALFIRKGIDFKAHQQGGGQERNRRAGTEPVALIVGLQHAARYAVQEMEQNVRSMQQLTARLEAGLRAHVPQMHVNTPVEGRAPHILNVSFEDAATLDGEAILQMLDMRGVAVSNGSACVSGSLQASHVLLALGRDKAEAKAAIRCSVGKGTTEQEIDQAIAIITDVIRRLRVTTHN